MPELPEVETTRRGIEPHLVGHCFTELNIRNPALRWPVPEALHDILRQPIKQVKRRAKYLLIETPVGTAILHLGMSGSLRLSNPDQPLRKHDHLILTLDNQLQLRFHDPRRFGAALWTTEPPETHPLLANLGLEPLSDDFTANYLKNACQNHAAAIKPTLMNNSIVVGVGNIYACEALFRAHIHPKRAANRISLVRLGLLVRAIQSVLNRSIELGGTTLRDFLNETGQAGYFKQQLNVYDRELQPCHNCQTTIKRITQAQRSTFFCPHCQR